MLIQEYNNVWKEQFTSIHQVLSENLGGVEATIEHVGSTAVSNLAAKPIIDIDIIYFQHPGFDIIKKNLVKLGYHHNGNQGIEGRDVFKRSTNTAHPILDSIKHHLYVCHTSNKEAARHLLFRDYLRQNEEARQIYEQLKYSIAARANQDRKEYAILKEQMARDFIESILDQARNNPKPTSITNVTETPSNTRVKSLFFAERADDEILVSEFYDSVLGRKLYRPLGGTVEFCERSIETARREILEEMGECTTNETLIKVFESIFHFNGREGHEIVFVYKGDFVNEKIYNNDEF